MRKIYVEQEGRIIKEEGWVCTHSNVELRSEGRIVGTAPMLAFHPERPADCAAGRDEHSDCGPGTRVVTSIDWTPQRVLDELKHVSGAW